MKIHAMVLLMAGAVMLCGCSRDTAVIETDATASADPGTVETDPVLAYINNMTLEEKVGQLFIVQPESFYSYSYAAINSQNANGLTVWTDELNELLEQYPVGGIALFGENVVDPDQLNTLMDALHHVDGVPLFLSVDEEGGQVARLGNNPNFNVKTYSSMLDVGKSNNWDDGYAVGSTIGAYLTDYGFNVDFAPDADVFTNPDNRVIGNRAFSSDPSVAANMVNAAVTGFHDAGMITCLKHFPGHGDTTKDSHDGYAASSKTWDEMMECEMVPFISGIQAGSDFIMAAHITTPNVTDDGLPASLSKEMLTDKLRGELGYTGIIITDAMNMEAIAKYYDSDEAAIMAFNAGADIILMPYHLSIAFQGILDAVNNGIISEERLEESLYRIISCKMKYGIISEQSSINQE